METLMPKEYGIAQHYKAVRLANSFVMILAVGQVGYASTRVTIEQLPWRIYPPHFGLFFETAEIGIPVTRPFVVSAIFLYPASSKKVVILDAAGRHEIDISDIFPFDVVERQAKEADNLAVYQQIGVANCMIAPADAMVPMIYTKVFGPATQPQCQAWIDKNCGKG
jgi:hypothetical protein